MADGYMARSKDSTHCTPRDVLDPVRAFFGVIDLDPCSGPGSIVKAGHAYDKRSNGLVQAWRGRVYVNPPFDDLKTWVAKCDREANARCDDTEIILLMPSRTDTKAWHDHVSTAQAVCFWKGRIKFLGTVGPCPFPVALVYWGRRIAEFRRAFHNHGMIVTL